MFVGSNKQTHTTMNNHTATLQPIWYAVEVSYTYTSAITGETIAIEKQRLQMGASKAFKGGRAKDIAKTWEAQSKGRLANFQCEKIEYVKI